MTTRKVEREAHARRRSPPLIFDDAVEIWKRSWLGDTEAQLAEAFGVNLKRVIAVLNERRHLGSREVALGKRRAPGG